MLSEILSTKTCAKCRFCCVFSKEAAWELPSSINAEFNENEETLVCPNLDYAKGCIAGENKPFACKLWPLRVMNYKGELSVCISARCYAYSDEFSRSALSLLKKGLLERIKEEVVNDPGLALNYDPSYKPLCFLSSGDEIVSSSLFFHRAQVGDAERIQDACMGHGTNICQYSVGYIIALAEKYDTAICFDNGILYVYLPGRSTDTHAAYLMPVGKNVNIKNSIELLADHAAALGKRPMIWGALSEDLRAVCESGFHYRLYDDRDWWDYIYSVEDLAALPGKTFHKKRTALNKFLRDHEGRFTYREVTKDNAELIRRYQRRWLCRRFENFGKEDGLILENEQINYMLDNFDSLGVRGGYVEIDGRVAGYTLCVPLGKDSYDMTTLKTSRKYPNITVYLINSFAKTLDDNVRYINFEEDIGSEGLRKFKNDFNPCALLKKSRIEIE